MVRGEGDIIELIRMKANYAAPMTDPVLVRWEDGYIAPIPAAALAASEAARLTTALAQLPRDEWMGIDTLRGRWTRADGTTSSRGEAQRVAGVLESTGAPGLEKRQIGGRTQWKVW